MSRRWNRALAALVLLAALGTAPAAAWSRGRDRHEGRITAPARAWILEAVERVWRGLAGTWEQEGLAGDPNG
ncbi:MAG TPA: hypothetical protein VNJ70_12795 [Thermoanaerobaculia bacterium]|nr:hypothetical protein [Thermoanaerobaculia bacterium]